MNRNFFDGFDSKEQRFYSDIILNEEKGEEKLGVLDWTNKRDILFGIDFAKLKLDDELEKCPILKVRGRIVGLDIRNLDNELLRYNGFLLVQGSFPLYLQGERDFHEVHNIKFEESLLRASVQSPIQVTGRVTKGDIREVPYMIIPYVLKLGDYVSPGRRIIG